jgi:hypothetical protein
VHSSGSTLIPLDPEIERTTCALKKSVREATLDGGIPEEEKLSSSSDSEEEVMAVAQPLTMRDTVNKLMKDRFLRGLYRQTLLSLILKILYFLA